MRIRKVLAITSAVIMAGGLAACGSPSDSADGKKSISIVLDNHPWSNYLEPLIPEFEKESGITVKVQKLAEDQMRAKVQLNLQSKSSGMDVFETSPAIEGQLFLKNGYYENLQPYIDRDSDEIDYDDFSSQTRQATMPDGKTVIGLPENVEGTVMFYRKDILDSYGIAVPKTMEELNAALEIIKQKGEVIPIALRGHPDSLAYTFGPFYHGYGNEWFDADGKPTFDSPESVAAIEQYVKLARDYGPPGVTNNTFTQSSALFTQGKVAFEIESSNEVSTLTDPKTSSVAEHVGVADIPIGPVGELTPTINIWAVAISPFSQAKDEAWEFVKWATSKKIELALAKQGIAPPRTSVAEDVAYTSTLDTPTLEQWSEVMANIQEHGNPEASPIGLQTRKIRSVMGNAIDKGILGQATPDEIAIEIQSGVEALLSEN